MQNGFDITLSVLRVSRYLLSRPDKSHVASDVARALELPTSTTFNVLYRMRDHEWIYSLPEANGSGRQLYRMTSFGRACATEALASLQIYST